MNSNSVFCDYAKLLEYGQEVMTSFRKLENYYEDIENIYKRVSNASNWDADACDFFTDIITKITKNKNLVEQKNQELSTYLDTVVSNYMSLEENGIKFY